MIILAGEKIIEDELGKGSIKDYISGVLAKKYIKNMPVNKTLDLGIFYLLEMEHI